MKLLYLIRDPYPTTRPDVLTLFGRQLARRGVVSDIVATRQGELADQQLPWPAGDAFIHEPGGRGGWRRRLGALWHDLRCLARGRAYDAVVVRDKILSASLALCRPGRGPVIYWASFPFPEEDLARAALPGRGVLSRTLLRARGQMTALLLYRWVLPRADAVFVQSDRMAEQFARRAGRTESMTAVPMGVDPEGLPPARVEPVRWREGDPFHLVYLGSMDRVRRIEFLLEVMAELRRRDPSEPYRLSLIGGASTEPEFDWLAGRVDGLGLADAVELTGPLSRERAWALAASAHLGLSAIPRGPVYDVSSPTKTVEYLVLGLPLLVNDIPDQQWLVAQTGAGACAPMTVAAFADAIRAIRQDHAGFAGRAWQARGWVLANRGYDVLADQVAQALRTVVSTRQ